MYDIFHLFFTDRERVYPERCLGPTDCPLKLSLNESITDQFPLYSQNDLARSKIFGALAPFTPTWCTLILFPRRSSMDSVNSTDLSATFALTMSTMIRPIQKVS
jgi:hypothetical protein